MTPAASTRPDPPAEHGGSETLPGVVPSGADPSAVDRRADQSGVPVAQPLVSSRVLITLAVVLAAVLLITVVVSLLVWQLPAPSPVDVPIVDRA